MTQSCHYKYLPYPLHVSVSSSNCMHGCRLKLLELTAHCPALLYHRAHMLNDTTYINRNTSSTDGPHDTLPLVYHPLALHPSRPVKSSLILLVLGWFSDVEKQRHFRSSRD